MNITVTSAQLDNIDLEAGDEIGIFDGDVCVGSGILEGTISSIDFPDNLLAMVASAQDGDTPGFSAGNPISYHYWDASAGIEVTSVDAAYLQGNEVFTPQGSAYVSLTGEGGGGGDDCSSGIYDCAGVCDGSAVVD